MARVLVLLFGLLFSIAANASSITLTGVGKPSGAVAATISFTTNTNTTNCNTCSFASQSIGTAATGRRVIVIWHMKDASVPVPSSFSVGGQAGTCGSVGTNANPTPNIHIFICVAQVDTGTTGTIVVTAGATMDYAAIGVFAAYNLNSSTPVDADTSATCSLPAMTTQSNGVAVAGATYTADGSATWSGITERYEVAGTDDYTGGDALTTGANLTAVATIGGAQCVLAGATYR